MAHELVNGIAAALESQPEPQPGLPNRDQDIRDAQGMLVAALHRLQMGPDRAAISAFISGALNGARLDAMCTVILKAHPELKGDYEQAFIDAMVSSAAAISQVAAAAPRIVMPAGRA